jgi:hypothetical protein
VAFVCLTPVFHAGAMAQTERAVKTDTVPPNAVMIEEVVSTPTFVVTYFHGDVRCATCVKLEAYAKEAIETAFEKELADSTVVWRTVNYDVEENKHYINDYALYTKALVVSQVDGEVERAWKNLDKIWEKVGDKDEYVKYVQDETLKFIAGDPDNE